MVRVSVGVCGRTCGHKRLPACSAEPSSVYGTRPRLPRAQPARNNPLSAAGKPTGEAYVEFATAEEAQRALKDRQHQHIGSRYIE